MVLQRFIVVVAALHIADAISCPMLGCSVDGCNVFSGEAVFGIDTSKNIGKKWSTVAAEGQVVRLQCTSAEAASSQFIACGVNRMAPNATGTFGLVGVQANGSVTWTDYNIGQALAHPVRNLLSAADAMVANDRVFVGDDCDGKAYGLPRALPMIKGGTFSMSFTENDVIFIAARGEESLGAYLFNSVPHAGMTLQDPQTRKMFRAIGTPIVNNTRGFFITQEVDDLAQSPTCAIFAIDVHRTLSNRLEIAWISKFRCPPNEARITTAEDEEVPLLIHSGVLYFPAGSANGSLLISALVDTGATSSLRFSKMIDISNATAGKIAMRSISLIPATANGEAEILAGFAPCVNSKSNVGISQLARLSSLDGSLSAVYDLRLSSTGSFSLAPGSRIMVLPDGMILPKSSTAAIDLAFMAVSTASIADIWMLAVRIPKSIHKDSSTPAFNTTMAVHLATIPDQGLAKSGIQVVPLSDSLVASVGGKMFAVGEVKDDRKNQMSLSSFV